MIQYSDAKLVVEKELDLEEENFIQDSEMLEYFNKARREAEAEVLGIYEDYLLDKAPLPLVLGQDRYDLPTGIYASKMRGIIYDNGSVLYEILRIRSAKKFLERGAIRTADPIDYYRYIMLNTAANGIQIELSPPSKETSATNVYIFFLRKIPDLVLDTDIVDAEIPESLNFIYAYVKRLCKQKENAGVIPPDAQAEEDKQRALMVETLTNMIPDDDNEVIKDMTIYYEMS